MTQTQDWTIGRLLTWTTGYLTEHGVEGPRLDAEVLLAEARGCRRIELYVAFDELADETVRTAFRELVRRRSEGTPVAYLVGRREFYSMNFRVTPDVLIPRPETELVVVALLDRIKQQSFDRPVRIADVGTGSGVLAVCAAKHSPVACEVTAVDISPAALEVARANAADHQVVGKITFVEGDLLDAMPAGPPFDFIVSNPPYVATSEIADLPRDCRDHEPRLALDGGEAGLAVIRRLIPQAAERLAPGGWLIMEIGANQPGVEPLLAEDGRFEVGPTMKDLAGLPRVVQAQRRDC
jgi:release factor glutamine methyltransferase